MGVTLSQYDRKQITKIRQMIQRERKARTSVLFQGSYPDEAALVADRGGPKQDWSYYNTTVGQTLEFNKGAWYQTTVDGENGASNSHQGSFTVAPLNPAVNDSYFDTVDLIVYIWDGIAWEVMSQTGTSVTVTYHDSDYAATPANPTGSGETGGWHLDATEEVNWLSQKVSGGDFGTPFAVKTMTGAVGPQGDQGDDGVDAFDDIDIPTTTGIVFSQSGSNVTWTTGNLKYKGVDYTIAVENTGDTNRFIYWDLNSLNTTFKTTNTLADVLGDDRWVMCYNDSGTPKQAVPFKVLHGGLIQADTITADQILANTITANEIFAQTITFAELRQVGGSEAVDTNALRDNSTADVASGLITGLSTLGTSYSVLASCTLTTEGGAVSITATAVFSAQLSQPDDLSLRIARDGTTLRQLVGISLGYSESVLARFELMSMSWVDSSPGAGSRTYTFEGLNSLAATRFIRAEQRTIQAVENKK